MYGYSAEIETQIVRFIENFRQVVKVHTAGEPMRMDFKWNDLSRRKKSKAIAQLDTPVRKNNGPVLPYSIYSAP